MDQNKPNRVSKLGMIVTMLLIASFFILGPICVLTDFDENLYKSIGFATNGVVGEKPMRYSDNLIKEYNTLLEELDKTLQFSEDTPNGKRVLGTTDSTGKKVIFTFGELRVASKTLLEDATYFNEKLNSDGWGLSKADAEKLAVIHGEYMLAVSELHDAIDDLENGYGKYDTLMASSKNYMSAWEVKLNNSGVEYPKSADVDLTR